MRVFQILNDEVLIINDKKEYKDSVANFKTDSGLTVELPVKSIYDDLQKLPVIQYAGQPERLESVPGAGAGNVHRQRADVSRC